MNIFKDLIAKDNLTVDNNKVVIKPEARQAYTVFPIRPSDHVISVTVDEYLGLKTRLYQFTEDLSGVEYFTPSAMPARHSTPSSSYSQETIKAAIAELTKMLENNNV